MHSGLEREAVWGMRKGILVLRDLLLILPLQSLTLCVWEMGSDSAIQEPVGREHGSLTL